MLDSRVPLGVPGPKDDVVSGLHQPGPQRTPEVARAEDGHGLAAAAAAVLQIAAHLRAKNQLNVVLVISVSPF